MPLLQPTWQLAATETPPEWFLRAVQSHCQGNCQGKYLPLLLWQRGIRNPEVLAGFLDPRRYQPASSLAFGEEMRACVDRLQRARELGEKVAIWGDFDADGVTATSVLWEGLGQFFTEPHQLTYYVPNRLRESHGLNQRGIDRLASNGVRLIITCDTGSTNLEEIRYANGLGMEVIVTDHHTLPDDRPPAIAIINPRYLAADHALAHLSGVAVAYKVVEALYAALPSVPQQPLEHLLDLVAIGLIADLVQLSGDCRYLAQMGIQRLQEDFKQPPAQRRRPGVGKLLEYCRGTGDRPTDISFGIGPRINAVSRIYGDASICITLLTSRDLAQCQQLAEEVELANTRRRSLQQDMTARARAKLEDIDLSTTSFIVLEDEQWTPGILGLVASEIARECGRPTLLLNTSGEMATGSARSVNYIDLYDLVKEQAHLLHRFGGHPFAAGLSLPKEYVPLLADALNQKLKQSLGAAGLGNPIVPADIRITVADLGQALFQELKWLEPCGMGNAAPQLLIEDCWFERTRFYNLKDSKGTKVRYAKTDFLLCDRTCPTGFPGHWWGHKADELPQGHCDAIVELDFNTYKKRYEVRLVEVRARATVAAAESNEENNADRALASADPHYILDWRDRPDPPAEPALYTCPATWDELYRAFEQARSHRQPLVLAYPTSAPPEPPQRLPQKLWETLVGVAKYLSRTREAVPRDRLQTKLQLSDRTLSLGLQALTEVGFQVTGAGDRVSVRRDRPVLAPSFITPSTPSAPSTPSEALQRFLDAVAEERFQQQYFQQAPVETLQAVLQGDRCLTVVIP